MAKRKTWQRAGMTLGIGEPHGKLLTAVVHKFLGFRQMVRANNLSWPRGFAVYPAILFNLLIHLHFVNNVSGKNPE
jgi:hypothetical protein